uniref:Uncharacterized protein n=1 Tax=Strigamia maritima TaxID=126957 RepID=T1IRZ1_STRMM
MPSNVLIAVKYGRFCASYIQISYNVIRNGTRLGAIHGKSSAWIEDKTCSTLALYRENYGMDEKQRTRSNISNHWKIIHESVRLASLSVKFIESKDDDLADLAELLRLPPDVLVLREAQDDYVVLSQVSIAKNTFFGPFAGRLVTEGEADAGSNCVEKVNGPLKGHLMITIRSTNWTVFLILWKYGVLDENGHEVAIMVEDQAGGWLRLLKSAIHPRDNNSTITLNGGHLWLTVDRDLAADVELQTMFRTVLTTYPPPCHVAYMVKKDAARASPDRRSSGGGNESAEDGEGTEVSQVTKDGDEPPSSYIKEEPHTPPEHAHQERKINHDTITSGAQVIYMPVIPKSTSEVKHGALYACVPCGIKFSSRSNLEAHQTYYCSHRHVTSNENSDKPVLPSANSNDFINYV